MSGDWTSRASRAAHREEWRSSRSLGKRSSQMRHTTLSRGERGDVVRKEDVGESAHPPGRCNTTEITSHKTPCWESACPPATASIRLAAAVAHDGVVCWKAWISSW